MESQNNSPNNSPNNFHDNTEGIGAFEDLDLIPGTVNFDIGGGKSDLNTQFLKEKWNITNIVYDPPARDEIHNQWALDWVTAKAPDTVTSMSVLNVIPSARERREHIRLARKILKEGGTAYFKVWKGDGSGLEGATREYWQSNRAAGSYLAEVAEVFGWDHVVLMEEKNLILARKG